MYIRTILLRLITLALSLLLILALSISLKTMPSLKPRPVYAGTLNWRDQDTIRVGMAQESVWHTYRVGEALAGRRVLAGAAGDNGQIWVGTDVGVSRFDGHSWYNYTPEPRGADYSSIGIDIAGRTWTAACGEYSWGPLLEFFDGHEWVIHRSDDGDDYLCVTDIAVDREGSLWFTTGEGVVEFDGVTWRTYTQDDGLVNNLVHDVFVDDANNKWFGTYDGLSRFDGSTWTTYSTGDPMRDYIVAVTVDMAGHIWIGSKYDGVGEFDGTSWRFYATADGLASAQVRSIAVDQSGHIWVGTSEGVSKFDGRSWQSHTTVNGFRLTWVNCIFADDQGHLWFCSADGVAELVRPNVEPPISTPPLPQPTSPPQEQSEGQIAFIGQDGNIWLLGSDSSEAQAITNGGGYGHPTWSPDGTQIATVSAEGDDRKIVIVDLVNGTETTLVESTRDENGLTWAPDPTWSPDGMRIAYVAGYTDIRVVDVEGTNSSRSIVNLDDYADTICCLSWSPIGDALALGSSFGMINPNLSIRAISPSTGTPLYGEWRDSPSWPSFGGWGEAAQTSPSWSPDGQWIVYTRIYDPTECFAAECHGINRPDLYIMRAGGSEERLIVENGDEATWSPDGTQLVYSNGTGIWRISLEERSEPVYLVAGRSPDWGPLPRASSVDLGFRPDPNGYQFTNTQLSRSEAMFEQYFGTENVSRPGGGWCTAAKIYFSSRYEWVANGWSCLGFSQTSLLSYLDRSQPYAGSFAIAHFDQLYQQPRSAELTEPIAYYAGVQTGRQWASEYNDWCNVCVANPGEMIDSIRQGIQSHEPVVVSLNTFVPTFGWHTVAPYRIEQVSPDAVDVYVYDSEEPGQERVIHFQDSGNGWRWTYTFVGSVAAAGARSGGCTDMYPYSLRTGLERGTPPVTFCETPSRAPGASLDADPVGRTLALVPTEGDWLIQDNMGRRIGWVSGEFISEIPDAYEIPQVLGDAALPHRTLYLPAADYVVTGNGLSTEVVELALFGDGHLIEVSGQTQSAGYDIELATSETLEQATLTSLQSFSSFAVSLDNESAAESRLMTVSGASPAGTESLEVGFDGDAMVISRAGGNLQYNLTLENSREGIFTSELLTLEANETHALRPADWAELEEANVTLEIDQDGDGTADETRELENQPLPISPPSSGGGSCPLSMAVGFVGLVLVGLRRSRQCQVHQQAL